MHLRRKQTDPRPQSERMKRMREPRVEARAVAMCFPGSGACGGPDGLSPLPGAVPVSCLAEAPGVEVILTPGGYPRRRHP